LDPIPAFERSPYELGLGWLVNLGAAPFVGRDALALQKQNGHRFTLRSFLIDELCQPDDGAEIFENYDDPTAPIGIVACSTWSWGMNKTIGNASIKTPHADIEEAWISMRGKPIKLTLSRGPLISLERRNEVPAPTSYRAGCIEDEFS
jgi:aminomethyltransferase